MKTERIIVAVLAIAVVILAGLVIRQREKPIDIEVERAAIRALDATCLQAAQAKHIERLLSACYADDASVFAPNTPLAIGKAAIRSLWSQWVANPGYALSWQIKNVEVSRLGDLAHASGTYESTLNDPQGKPVTDRGKWVVVYKKQPDGSWKVVSDIWNSDQPATVVAAKP